MGFDGIRGIAMLMLVFYHGTIAFFPEPGFVPLPPHWTIVGAYVAVDLFFALSGYLLTRLVIESQIRGGGRLDVSSYFSRRAIRIVPGLMFFAAGHVIYSLLADLPKRNEVISLALAFTATLNIPNPIHGFALNDGLIHLWTLAIELQFYLVLPLIVAVLRPSRPKRSGAVIIAAMLAVAAWRMHLDASGVFGAFLLIRTDTHIDSVLAGVALAYLWPLVKDTPRVVVSVLGWAGLAGWLFMAFRFSLSDPFTYRQGFTVAALLSTLMITAIARDTGPAALFKFKPFVMLGDVSYGFYMWHVMVFQAYVRWGDDLPIALQVGGAVLTTMVFTAISWYLVEKPAMEYFAHRRRAAVVPVAGAR